MTLLLCPDTGVSSRELRTASVLCTSPHSHLYSIGRVSPRLKEGEGRNKTKQGADVVLKPAFVRSLQLFPGFPSLLPPGSVLVGPLEKRVFSSLWPCHCFFLIFVARVSTVTELTGSVAKKKSTDKKATNWKNSLKNWTFGRIFYVNDVLLIKNGAAVDLLRPSCCKVVWPLSTRHT